MKISVELTLTPLKDDFIPAIKHFIKQLKTSGFTVLENPLSTQIYGDYDTLFPFLTDQIKAVFDAEESVILMMKIVKGDRSHYVSDL